MSVTIRAGIVGCGRIGCGFDDDPGAEYVRTHAGAYVRTPGVHLVALCDTDPSKLEQYGRKFRVQNRYKNFRQMLAHEKLNILSVCTWNETHREIVELAVEAGVRAIFCEKPVADSLEAADAMIRRCAESDVILMINHPRRFDPFHQEVASYLREGLLGRVQQATCYYTAGSANTGSHLFDLLRFFFGEVEWVQGVYSHNSSPNPDDPNVDGWLRFENGLLAVIQACDAQSYTIFEIDILGTLGRLRLMSHGLEAQFEGVQESARFAGYSELRHARLPLHCKPSYERMLLAVAELRACMEEGKKPLCSGEDGRRVLEIIFALRESAEAGSRRIHLPLADSPIVIQSR